VRHAQGAEPTHDAAGEMFELTSDEEGRVAALVCRGELDVEAVGQLKTAIDTVLRRPKILFYLDLEDITRIDSSGLDFLVATIARCASHEIHLELWAGPTVVRMLDAAGVAVPLRAYPARPCLLFGDLAGR
jgi:anti-anti-sigma factor